MKIRVWKYISNIFLSLDQMGNVLLGGDFDETISSRLGKIKAHYGGRIPWYRPLARATDKWLDLLDPGHSIRSIEEDEGKNASIEEVYEGDEWDKDGNVVKKGG